MQFLDSHCTFSTNSDDFLTEKIMGAQNSDFAPKLPQNGGFSATNFAFLQENFPIRRSFLKAKNLGNNCPSASFVPRHHSKLVKTKTELQVVRSQVDIQLLT